MESLCGGEGLLQKRWCCAWGWWMLVVLTRHRCMEPCFIIIAQNPTSWAYIRNRQPCQHTDTTELVGFTRIPGRGFASTSPGKQAS